ncbi:hypothetical protein EDD16DRAFT_1518222 [Pisolithus croceorrhizus]|nr:hypothetical protein EDD16DRAFT_1518222 [Pisolithus croceorrhizus]
MSPRRDMSASDLGRVHQRDGLSSGPVRTAWVPSVTISYHLVPLAIALMDLGQSCQWGMKPLHSYLNGWVPALSINARCVDDVKLVLGTYGEVPAQARLPPPPAALPECFVCR